MCVVCNAGPCGGRPAWSTAVGLGPIPYWFAGSNPAPRIYSKATLNEILFSKSQTGARSRVPDQMSSPLSLQSNF